MTTPPLPSSSPAVDRMDVSPLPHKTPFSVDSDMDMDSPTAEIMSKSQGSGSHSGCQDTPFDSSRLDRQEEYVDLGQAFSLLISDHHLGDGDPLYFAHR